MAGSGTIAGGGPDRKPMLTLRQILNMSVGFFGIQFGFGLQNANMSRIFRTLGAELDEVAILWIAAPLTGLLVQPIIGYFSDKTWSERFGRRRPYFLVGAILASMALIFMPNAWVLWTAVIGLWVLDTSINISMEPFRAFVGDLLPSSQRNTGFAAQSFFIGLGAVLSSFLPQILTWMGVSNDAPEGVIADSVKLSFYLGAAAFILAVLWTVFTTKEYSPEEVERYEAAEADVFDKEAYSVQTPANLLFKHGSIWLAAGALLTFLKWHFEFGNKEMYLFTMGIGLFGLILLAAGLFRRMQSESGFSEVVDNLMNMPQTMRQLAVVQLFSWFALFAMWIYTTDTIALEFYGTLDANTPEYQKASNWVGVCFGIYNGVAALVAFLLPVLAARIGRRQTHALALLIGGLSLVSILVISNRYMLLIPMVGIGIAWASILSMPYAILSGVLPSSKMGLYMGVFNFFIVIPQLIAASLLGFIVGSLFDNQPVFSLIIGGTGMVIAALFTLRVSDKDEEHRKTVSDGDPDLTNYYNR
jgi:maltose/moltooligosaccharide transporter